MMGLLSDKSADIYNQKTLRSMEVIFICQSTVDQFLRWLKLVKTRFTSLGNDSPDVSVDYKAVKTDGNFALVMGNEGQGISQEMAESADQLVHINMPGPGRESECCCGSRNSHV